MKPYFAGDGLRLYLGDALDVLLYLDESFDVCLTDPPYGDTSLSWDRRVGSWWVLVDALLEPGGSLWCFGSLRFMSHLIPAMIADGWSLAQDVVWEKHNGSSFHADRFKRVHEFAVMFYRGKWGNVRKSPVFTNDATKRTVWRKTRPPHTGHIENGHYTSEDGGPKMMRSVLHVRGCHGHAIAPTQKPLGILRPLLEFSQSTRVLDPFCGSGSTLVASYRRGTPAVGVDSDERQLEKTARRLNHIIDGNVDPCEEYD